MVGGGVPVDIYSSKKEISKTMGQNNWTPLTLLWRITLNTSDHARYSLFTSPRGFYPIWPKFTYRALSPPFNKKKFSNVNNVRVERVPKPTFLASIFVRGRGGVMNKKPSPKKSSLPREMPYFFCRF